MGAEGRGGNYAPPSPREGACVALNGGLGLEVESYEVCGSCVARLFVCCSLWRVLSCTLWLGIGVPGVRRETRDGGRAT